jgi:hypothetical protein
MPGCRRAIVAMAISGLGASAAQGQKISLQLRPHVGDTISMRLEQETEVSGRRDAKSANSSTAPSSSWSSTSISWSRAIVESAVPAYTTIDAVTDSVLQPNPAAKTLMPGPPRPVKGQQVRLMVAPDGSMTMPNGAAGQSSGLARAASLIPATFPAEPVRVGDKWTREAALPAGTSQFGAGVVGRVKAVFRFDSLTRAGDLAWVSIHGDLVPDEKAHAAEGGLAVEDGVVTGYMVIDRTRGWLTESSFSIIAHSVMRPAFGVAAQPMHFTVHLTQSLRTQERK